MAGKFEIKKAVNGKVHFVLKAGNGEAILASQFYEALDGATKGIESVRQNAALDERYERRASGRQEPYFVLKAANGQIIGTSEMYSSERARDGGIDSVKRTAPEAKVDDLRA